MALFFLKGTEATACRWDQVAFVWERWRDLHSRGNYTGSRWKYTVQRTGQSTGKPAAKKEEVPNLILFMALVGILKLEIW